MSVPHWGPEAWSAWREDVAGGQRYGILRAGRPVSFLDVFRGLDTDRAFALWYTKLLAACEYEAFFWEHPAATAASADAQAEFVLLDAPALARLPPDSEPFAARFQREPEEDVLVFPNLGGDALLVAPAPRGAPAAYPHLGAFVRLAPAHQVRQFWQQIGRAVRTCLGAEPRWVSTSGLGVAWLHARVDSVPKYYQFATYRAAP